MMRELRCALLVDASSRPLRDREFASQSGFGPRLAFRFRAVVIALAARCVAASRSLRVVLVVMPVGRLRFWARGRRPPQPPSAVLGRDHAVALWSGLGPGLGCRFFTLITDLPVGRSGFCDRSASLWTVMPVGRLGSRRALGERPGSSERGSSRSGPRVLVGSSTGGWRIGFAFW